MAKKVCISGYYGFNNFGDEGILDVLISNLKTFDSNMDITVFTNDIRGTSLKHLVKTIRTFDFSSIRDALKKTDVLISGGGSLLQDSTSIKSLFYYLWVIWTALFFKKKVIIFAQGIGPINNPFGRFLTKNILKNVSYISVREEKSLFLLRGWGLKPVLAVDPMWNINLLPKDPLGRVGIQLRSWKGLTETFINTLARQVVAHFPDKEIYIYSFQDSQDMKVCKNFQNMILSLDKKIKTKLLYNLPNESIIKSFRHLDYLIAMRYHACLLGAKYDIPLLPINYDEKVERLARDLCLSYLNLYESNKIEEKVGYLKNMRGIPMIEKIKTFEYDFLSMLELI